MPLPDGTRLGPYQILSAIGAGGMGEVYKARDTRLNRSVAIKVLPSELASDPDRRSRFEREAHAIAALSHPHICVVHDIGRDNGTDYLVMELLEGETLAERLRRAKARPLPMPDVLRYATEIADALDKAHRAGIVHRDLKPANIMLTKSGVKLLDFGLAKLKGPAVPISMTAIEHATTTGGPKTATGTILGTVHYMSPEQVEGREADARADIWALGAVSYEMATGTRPFEGDSPASIIGGILKDEPPPLSSRQPLVPAALDAVVSQCLAKDRELRWQSAYDVATALKWTSDFSAPPAVAKARWSAWPVVAITTAALAAFFAFRTSQPPAAVQPAQFLVLPPDGGAFSGDGIAGSNPPSPQIAMASDGRRLAFVAMLSDGRPRVWIRSRDSVAAHPLAGTEGAAHPFWSPDGKYIGFFAAAKLKTILADGGPVQVLCNAVNPRGGTWNKDGVIVFAAGFGDGLQRISAAGGQAATATEIDTARGEISHRWPQFLPDGRHFLYLALNATRGQAGIYVGSLDSKETVRVLDTDFHAEFSEPGFIFFVREGGLLAQRFDPASLRTTRDAIPIADHVGSGPATGESPFSVVGNALAYTNSIEPPVTQLTWTDRTGQPHEALGTPGQFESPALSADWKRAAAHRTDPVSGIDVWLMDGMRPGNPSRFTFDPAVDYAPVWSPDGRTIAFSSNRTGTFGVYAKHVGEGGDDPLIVTTSNGLFPTSWSPDGKLLLYTQAGPKTGFDVWMLSLADRKATQVLKSTANETQGQLSANGRWLAYTSDETGVPEVYVQPFPPTGLQSQVSSGGGSDPQWRSDGRELFYITLDGKLTAAQVTGDPSSFVAGRETLFQTHRPNARGPILFSNYRPAADGQRFLFNTIVGEIPTLPLFVTLDWAAAVKP
jgi:eukaryotic-like serine/threonine-protein kinase